MPSLSAAGLSRAVGASSASGSAHLPGAPTMAAGTGVDFGSILADVVSSTSRSLQAAEGASSAAMFGKTTARDVVETLMKAEQDLHVALALRDKVVAALQEVSRMAI